MNCNFNITWLSFYYLDIILRSNSIKPLNLVLHNVLKATSDIIAFKAQLSYTITCLCRWKTRQIQKARVRERGRQEKLLQRERFFCPLFTLNMPAALKLGPNWNHVRATLVFLTYVMESRGWRHPSAVSKYVHQY